MGDFRNIAERLATILEDKSHEGGIRSKDIPGIISGLTGQGNINCYPGIPGYGCCNLSFYVSLNSPSYAMGRGHLSCRTAVEKIIQHMQGLCFQKTRIAVLLTDRWDPNDFYDWKANLNQIKGHAQIEIYLLSGGNVSEMNI